MMEGMEQGDVIIRPSSKGKDNLSCSWKVIEKHGRYLIENVDIKIKQQC